MHAKTGLFRIKRSYYEPDFKDSPRNARRHGSPRPYRLRTGQHLHLRRIRGHALLLRKDIQDNENRRKGLCPKGWALPTQQDFKEAFGNANAAALKEEASFGMKFAGFRYFDGKFADKGASASFWTSDSYDDSRAYLVRATDTSITYEHFNKNIFASVRCVKE